jgi:tRNA 2-selenouridine synthase
VRLLRAEYEHFEAHPDLLERQLDCLSALHGKERVAYWKGLARDRAWDTMVERLLVEHYDPAYLRSIRRNFVQVEAAQTLALGSDGEAEFDALARRLAA